MRLAAGDMLPPAHDGHVVFRWSDVRRHMQRIVRTVIGGQADGGRDGAPMTQTHEWICVFDARVGGRAKAVFETRDRAIQFAEHHASALMPASMPLKWEDANTAAISTTQLGLYLVARQPVRAPKRHASPMGDYGRPRQVT